MEFRLPALQIRLHSSITAYYPSFQLSGSALTHLWSSSGGAHSLIVLTLSSVFFGNVLFCWISAQLGVFFVFFLAALHCFLPLWLNPLFFLSTFSLSHLVFSFSLSSSQILLESSVRHAPSPPPQFHAHRINPGEAAAMPFSAPYRDIGARVCGCCCCVREKERCAETHA